MSYSRNKRDANEPLIVEVFKRYGGYWESLCDGTHDGNLHLRGVTFNVEVKDGSKPPSGRPLTDRERDFQREIESRGVRLWIITSPEEAALLCAARYEEIPERPEYAVDSREYLNGKSHRHSR